jgi:ElaB/YqjD/DUF883 family membrane-anchored ribosome-binding protein
MNGEEEDKLASVAQLQKELSDLLAEREEVLKKAISSDKERSVWYSARLRIMDYKIHQIRNRISLHTTHYEPLPWEPIVAILQGIQ